MHFYLCVRSKLFEAKVASNENINCHIIIFNDYRLINLMPFAGNNIKFLISQFNNILLNHSTTIFSSFFLSF